MSYDVFLYIHTGIKEIEVPDTHSNYTYNVHKMLHHAFGIEKGIDLLDGLTGDKCIPLLRKAVRTMEDHPNGYTALIPANGWGTYEGCLAWLRTILSHCEQHPLATLRIT